MIEDDRKGIENNRALINSKKDATFLINKPQKFGIRPSNLKITFDESYAIKETLTQLRKSVETTHPSQNLIDDLDHLFSSIIERSNHVPSVAPITHIPINTVAPLSSSNSSSLTSSSANSPVQINNHEHSPSNSTKSSSTSSTSNLTSNQAPNRVLHNSANFERPLSNANVNFKRSTESIFSQVSNVKTIQSNFSSNLSRTPIVKCQESTRSEPVSIPINNSVKKMVSRFDAQSQVNSLKPAIKKTDDEKFLNPSSIVKLSKCLQTPIQTPSTSSLLTISSSSSTTVSSSHSPSSSMPQSSTSSSSSLSSNNGSYNTKCVYYVDKDPSPYMVTIHKKYSFFFNVKFFNSQRN